MKLRHKAKGYEITVLSKHGKPIVGKNGFVTLTGKGKYRLFNTMCIDALEDKFEEVV